MQSTQVLNARVRVDEIFSFLPEHGLLHPPSPRSRRKGRARFGLSHTAALQKRAPFLATERRKPLMKKEGTNSAPFANELDITLLSSISLSHFCCCLLNSSLVFSGFFSVFCSSSWASVLWVLVISQFPCLVHRLLLFQLSFVSFVCSLRSPYWVFFFPSSCSLVLLLMS